MADSKDRWNPEQYERYRDERSQPFFDLMALVEARPASSLGLVASRPAYSALASERGSLLPSLESALTRYVSARPRPSPRARAREKTQGQT